MRSPLIMLLCCMPVLGLASAQAEPYRASAATPRPHGEQAVYHALVSRLGQSLTIHTRNADGSQTTFAGQFLDSGKQRFRLDDGWGRKVELPYVAVTKISSPSGTVRFSPARAGRPAPDRMALQPAAGDKRPSPLAKP